MKSEVWPISGWLVMTLAMYLATLRLLLGTETL